VAVLQVSAPASVFCAHSEPVPNRTVVEADSHASPPSLATHFQPVESVVARRWSRSGAPAGAVFRRRGRGRQRLPASSPAAAGHEHRRRQA
jgi:hypothetical protein